MKAMQQVIFSAAISCLTADAAIVPGASKSGLSTLFVNNDSALKPKAKDSVGGAITVAEPKWTILNWSYYDEDTGDEYLEIHNELTMPIISTDQITFHVEFYKSAVAPVAGLFRDGFECSLTKQLTTTYWDMSAKDIYVRTSASTAAADDFNNSVENDGQDWFVYEADAVRGDGDHLCTASNDSSKGIQCDKIKCIIRRKSVTEDPDDMVFDLRGDSAPSELQMTFPLGYSYILMNQNDSTTLAETSKQRMNTMWDANIKIYKNSLLGTAVSTIASVGAFLALTAF